MCGGVGGGATGSESLVLLDAVGSGTDPLVSLSNKVSEGGVLVWVGSGAF